MSISIKKIRPYIVILMIIAGLWGWDAYQDVQMDNGIQATLSRGDAYDPDIAGELLVSPYGVQDRLIDLFADTRYKLDFRLYQFTETKTQQLFLNLLQAGREMRWISEDRPYGGASKDYEKYASKFERDGGDARSDRELKLDTNFNHTKTFLIDDTTAIISTANLSYSSMTRNRDYRFVTQDVDIVKNLSYIYERDWSGDPVSVRDIHPSLLVCPINCRDQIEDAIRESTESIYIQAQYIADERVAGLLLAQAKKGIDVSIMVSSNQDDKFLKGLKELQEQQELEKQKSDVGDNTLPQPLYMKGEIGQVNIMIVPKDHDSLPYIHSKNMLIDEDTLIMGSMNFSSNALDNNREIGISTTNENLVRRFLGQWERDVGSY